MSIDWKEVAAAATWSKDSDGEQVWELPEAFFDELKGLPTNTMTLSWTIKSGKVVFSTNRWELRSGSRTVETARTTLSLPAVLDWVGGFKVTLGDGSTLELV